MSAFSGESSGPCFRGAAGRRQATEARSPVPYRDPPMTYEPAVLCGCNPQRKAPLWISWSRQNLGRRYYACVDAMNGRGCGFVEWHDNPLPKFWSDLIGDLSDEVWRLRALQAQPNVSENLVASEPKVKALEDQLKQKDLEIATIKGKYETVIIIFFVFVLGLVLGKWFIQ